MLRVAFTWTTDYIHFPRALLDIVGIKKRKKGHYQLHLQNTEVRHPQMAELAPCLSNSEPLFALGLRALNRLGCAQNEKSAFPSAKNEIKLLDISVLFSHEGVEPGIELEGVRATIEDRSATCSFRNVKGESKKWSLILSQQNEGPYTIAAMLFRKALSDTSYVNAAYSGPL